MISELVDKIAGKHGKTVFPFTFTRKGIYILPTPQGLLFLTLLAVMLAGSLNYSNNLGFLFTFLLGAMAFISMLHTHRNLLGLTIRSASVQTVFAGDEGWLTLEFNSDDDKRPGLVFTLKNGEKKEETFASCVRSVSLRVATEKRGYHAVEAITVSSSYPFGLFRTWSTIRPQLGYLVYPMAMAGPFTPSGYSDGSENLGMKETEGVDDFKGLRPYRAGDPLGRLSWKTYARGKGLHTKEFSALVGDAVMISWNDTKEPDIEKKLSRLCHMVLKAHDMNLAYGLSIPGQTILKGEPKDKAHRHTCLKALALYGIKERAHRGKES